jgi:hypothetical protein
MNPSIPRQYFRTDGYINTIDVFRPLRSAVTDDEIARIVQIMDREAKEILGVHAFIRFDRANFSKDVSRRISQNFRTVVRCAPNLT